MHAYNISVGQRNRYPGGGGGYPKNNMILQPETSRQGSGNWLMETRVLKIIVVVVVY